MLIFYQFPMLSHLLDLIFAGVHFWYRGEPRRGDHLEGAVDSFFFGLIKAIQLLRNLHLLPPVFG
jgi:hypothetical protein